MIRLDQNHERFCNLQDEYIDISLSSQRLKLGLCHFTFDLGFVTYNAIIFQFRIRDLQ